RCCSPLPNTTQARCGPCGVKGDYLSGGGRVRLEVGGVLDHLICGPHERANDPLQGVEL
ncbi:unnamed protein product, partial [Scytosiphon promiscuus]